MKDKPDVEVIYHMLALAIAFQYPDEITFRDGSWWYTDGCNVPQCCDNEKQAVLDWSEDRGLTVHEATRIIRKFTKVIRKQPSTTIPDAVNVGRSKWRNSK